MLYLLSGSINPALPLRDAVQNWDRIAQALAERHRARTKQMDAGVYTDSLS
jgi:hypothetical protein